MEGNTKKLKGRSKMTELIGTMIRISLIASFGNVLAAIILGAGAKDQKARWSTVILLLTLASWSLTFALQSIPEVRESYPGVIETLLLGFFLIPPAVLHTAFAWSGREGCGVSRWVVITVYLIGGGASFAQACGFLALGPIVDHGWGAMHVAHNGVFLAHGVFLMSCALLGVVWCAIVVLGSRDNRLKLHGLAWLILVGVFLPFAVTNYFVVQGIPIIAVGLLGNLLFLILLAVMLARWGLLDVEGPVLKAGAGVALFLLFVGMAVDAVVLGLWGQPLDARWLAVQLGCGAAVIAPFAGYTSLRLGIFGLRDAHHPRSQPTGYSGSSKEEGDTLLGDSRFFGVPVGKRLNGFCTWMGCQGFVVYRRDLTQARYILLASVGAPRGLPRRIRGAEDLKRYVKNCVPAEAVVRRTPHCRIVTGVEQIACGWWVWTYPDIKGHDLLFLLIGLVRDEDGVIRSKHDLESFLRAVWPPAIPTSWQEVLLPKARRVARTGEEEAARRSRITRGGNYGSLKQAIKLAPEEVARLKALFPEMVGDSPALLKTLREVERLAPAPLPIVLYGETGVGKELFAQALHRLSGRKGNFVAFNCGAIQETLAEDTFLGHVSGAFTGASGPHQGLFSVANGGTLFLDEMDSLPLPVQAKLLRVVEDQLVLPVGSAKPVPVNVRIVTATHRPLPELVAEGQFRADLFFRLAGAAIYIPTLREREEDVILLAHHFLKLAQGASSDVPKSFTDRALDRLRAYDWPGNVRELQHAVSRAVWCVPGPEIGWDDIELFTERNLRRVDDPFRAAAERCLEDGISLQEAVKVLKRELAAYALELTHGNVAAAARQLSMKPFNFARLLRSLAIRKHRG